MTDSTIREADEVLAPFVFVYILGTIASIGAVIAWIFWFRGYA